MIDYINKDLIKELRRRTNVSMMICKQELVKSNGNVDLAIENIRKSGLKMDLTKSNRLFATGVIMSKISSDKRQGLMLEINCETDFVSRNILFREFANSVVNTAFRESITDVNVLNTRFKKERLILVNQIGENIEIRRLSILHGYYVSVYIHNFKIGVLISISGKVNPDITKYIAMHIVSENPKYIYANDIPNDNMKKERDIQMNIIMNTIGDKSHKILDKIIDGRMDKFISDLVLTRQLFIKDMKKTVGNVLDEHCMKVNDFIRFEIGERIDCN